MTGIFFQFLQTTRGFMYFMFISLKRCFLPFNLTEWFVRCEICLDQVFLCISSSSVSSSPRENDSHKIWNCSCCRKVQSWWSSHQSLTKYTSGRNAGQSRDPSCGGEYSFSNWSFTGSEHLDLMIRWRKKEYFYFFYFLLLHRTCWKNLRRR